MVSSTEWGKWGRGQLFPLRERAGRQRGGRAEWPRRRGGRPAPRLPLGAAASARALERSGGCETKGLWVGLACN
jgi:hypothetical protein